MIETIDVEKCIGCGNCNFACPMDVIYLDPIKRVSEIKYRDHCQTCFNCELACPTGAVFVDTAKKEKVQPWKT